MDFLYISKLLNNGYSKLLNNTMLNDMESPHQFGKNFDESVSSVLTKNFKAGLLSPLGNLVVNLINRIDPKHIQ